jgi:hypothetical protein
VGEGVIALTIGLFSERGFRDRADDFFSVSTRIRGCAAEWSIAQAA